MEEGIESLGPRLLEAFEKVPDPRSPSGRRHPLPAILTLAVCAMPANCHSLYAIHQWGREHAELAPRLGFKGGKTPAVSTLRQVFKRLDKEAFEAVLRGWVQGELGHRAEAAAIDGKSLRGIHGGELPGVDLVPVCTQQSGLTLAQKGGEKQAELSVAQELPAQVDLTGKVVTGDALYARRNLSRQVVEQGGGYFRVVKDNQPFLRAAIALLFAEPPWGEEFATAAEWGRHGDRREERKLWASTALNEYLGWPLAQQVCCVERAVTRKGVTGKETAYAITGLNPGQTGAQGLLRLWRGHWGIENRLHYVRDVTMREDASQARSGAAPQVMAALRNPVPGLLRQTGATNIAAALRHYSYKPLETLALLGVPSP